MVVHSAMVKKVGTVAAIIGVLMILLASIMFIPTQEVSFVIPFIGEILFGILLGYAINVGVYFVMIGILVWIIGAAIEYKASKTGISEPTEQDGGQ